MAEEQILSSGIVKKLFKVQQALKAPKNADGRFGKHRNVEGILEALKPILKENDLSLVLDNKILEVGDRTYVQATARLYDDSGQCIEVSSQAWEGQVSRGLDAPQVTGSASSYARKYALAGLFAIDDTKDPDSHDKPAETGSHPVSVQQKVKLKSIMRDKGIELEDMGSFIQSVIQKPKVETVTEFEKIQKALETNDE